MNIGIDIGGTHTRIAIGTAHKLDKKFDFQTRDFSTTVKQIKESIEKIAQGKIKVGIAVPGPIESSSGVLRNLPNLESFRNQPLREILSEELSCPVDLGHDASLAAYAESLYGSGVGKNPVLYYTVSTGIGTGLVVDGKIFRGVYNPEAGHQIVSGVNKNLEEVASGTGLKNLYGKDPSEIVGSPEWDKAMERLARGITNSILHYSPEVVIIGGGLTTNKESFFEPLIEKVRNFLTTFPLPQITIPKLGENSTIIGALEIASAIKV